jgi:DNA polymerase-3 subunit gamma/tau
MALLRVMHAASMPDPGEIARLLREGGSVAVAQTASAPVASAGPSASLPKDVQAVVDLLWEQKKGRLADFLHDCVRIVQFDPPQVELQLTQDWNEGDFCRTLAIELQRATGVTWQIRRSEGSAAPSLLEQQQENQARERAEIFDTPVVKAVLAAFPDADLDRTEPWSAER